MGQHAAQQAEVKQHNQPAGWDVVISLSLSLFLSQAVQDPEYPERVLVIINAKFDWTPQANSHLTSQHTVSHTIRHLP